MTVKLWPEGIPGAKKSDTYHEEIVMNDRDLPRVSKVTDPELLVYLPPKEKATGAAVVICPGGGYGILAIDHEGYDIAKWLNEMGIAGIILKYRLPSDEIMEDRSVGPLQDAQEAIRTVRRKAAEWSLSPDKIGVMGFSAGGHLAGTASTMYAERVYTSKDNISARPDFSLLIYGVLSMQEGITHGGTKKSLLGDKPGKDKTDRFSNELRVDTKTPPAFLVHSLDDDAVPVENSILYYQGLRKAGVTGELHIYESGGHGYGLAPNGATESMWPEACKAWMKKHGWVK
ncbi:MAG TPA: alpha/beta hydrolase [Cyclobacteriaceae bacterium]|nr:alpha/beta hydrolase [Cyclobacteriaceae bacterium]